MNRRPLLLATAGGLFLPGILRAQDAAGIGTAARPTVTSFTPTSGPVGTTITVDGGMCLYPGFRDNG